MYLRGKVLSDESPSKILKIPMRSRKAHFLAIMFGQVLRTAWLITLALQIIGAANLDAMFLSFCQFSVCAPKSYACIAQILWPRHPLRIWEEVRKMRDEWVSHVLANIHSLTHMSGSQDLARLICGNENGTIFYESPSSSLHLDPQQAWFFALPRSQDEAEDWAH